MTLLPCPPFHGLVELRLVRAGRARRPEAVGGVAAAAPDHPVVGGHAILGVGGGEGVAVWGRLSLPAGGAQAALCWATVVVLM